MGYGGLYTLRAGLTALACLMVLLTFEKGALWREREEEELEGRGGVNKARAGERIVYFFQILRCACKYPVVCRPPALGSLPLWMFFLSMRGRHDGHGYL